MRWILAAVLVLAVTLGGCVTAPGALFGPPRHVAIGMDKNEVRQSYGYCMDRRSFSNGTSVWHYQDGTVVWFEAGRVTDWSVTR